MFNNIGEKLKNLAKIIFWLGTIASVISFGWLFIDWSEVIFLLCIPVGIFASWLTTCGLYAFGRLVENSDKLVEIASCQNNIAPVAVPVAPQPAVNYAPAAPIQAAPVAPVQTAPAGKVCPNCSNVGEGSFCLYCGTALK